MNVGSYLQTFERGVGYYHSRASYGQQIMWRLRELNGLSREEIQQAPKILRDSLFDSLNQKHVSNIRYNLQNMIPLLERAVPEEPSNTLFLRRDLSKPEDGLLAKHYSDGDVSTLLDKISQVTYELIHQDNLDGATDIIETTLSLSPQSSTSFHRSLRMQQGFIYLKREHKNTEHLLSELIKQTSKIPNTSIERAQLINLLGIAKLAESLNLPSDGRQEQFITLKHEAKECFIRARNLDYRTSVYEENAKALDHLVYGVIWTGFRDYLHLPQSMKDGVQVLEPLIKAAEKNSKYTTSHTTWVTVPNGKGVSIVPITTPKEHIRELNCGQLHALKLLEQNVLEEKLREMSLDGTTPTSRE